MTKFFNIANKDGLGKTETVAVFEADTDNIHKAETIAEEMGYEYIETVYRAGGYDDAPVNRTDQQNVVSGPYATEEEAWGHH